MIANSPKVTVFLMAALAASFLQGADYFYDLCLKDEPILKTAKCLHVLGDIVPGDYANFANFILSDPDKFHMAYGIKLGSRGGDIEEAIAMAKLIRKSYAPTMVGADYKCASACFILRAAGVERKWLISNPDLIRFWDGSQVITNIGLHRAYLSEEKTKSMSPNKLGAKLKAISANIAEMLKGWDVPNKYTEIMLATSSIDAYSLTSKDIDQISTVQVGYEESIIAHCRIKDPRIRCNLFGDCKNIDDLLSNSPELKPELEKTIDCQQNYLYNLQEAFLVDLAKKI